MDHSTLAKFWNDAWTEGLWAAGWEKSIADLTPQQAAWKPAAGRHSIWQIALHIIFWRENELRRTASGQKPTPEEIERLNFPEPEAPTAAAWDKARERLKDAQSKIAALIADPAVNIERIAYLLPHDCYH